ncbi:MAG: NAD-dependent epimerase/dehydratase family protein [SAR202 cluster bacterium]|jgi:nucleoside-diphosphate-sugar epimerase|nr:NAD-dependent dehydratase [Chloroflexota bacterium]MDP7612801.1 NAD-dependent epimerase/dehydratase family protein [Dehalococcoidia bacterium]MQG47074.1 NAD-dependent epimerase/dehydratase family protein [SAR202 cluster bacterium]|tara:strand:+ start:280 stop:1251 length:972 start_codon:yes stop_codon:yes gene_type:complete
MEKRILVTGAGGFIAHHLVKYLKSRGEWVRAVDILEPEFEVTQADDFNKLDLRLWDSCVTAVEGVEEVYHLAADMGGIGYITAFHADIARNNVLMNTHMLEASRQAKVKNFFYSSSACVYPDYRQSEPTIEGLKEEEAYPAAPEEGYGWEKLFTEKLCQYYAEDYGLETRVARFHNVYGPLGTYDGGKEKAPAAICRKIASSHNKDEIEVWGDGKQTRSFMYIDDCVEGIYRLMQSKHREPLNLGTDVMVSVNELVDIVADVAEKEIHKRYDLSKPQGVRGRNSDNTKLAEYLDWTPTINLKDGLEITYKWINQQVANSRINS